MLTASQLNALIETSAARERWRQAELDIIIDMVKRIKKAGKVTGTAEWQAERLAALSGNRDAVRKILANAARMSEQDLVELYRDAVARSLDIDDAIYRAQGLAPPEWTASPQLQQIFNAGLQQTHGTFLNLTQQTASNATSQLAQILDRSQMQMMSGAFTYDQAIKQAITTLANQGVHAIKYKTRTDSLDVASRRALLTGTNQTALRCAMGRAQSMGCNLVETSAHMGARADHAPWQGRVFQLTGQSSRYPNFYTATGYGTVRGLGGANCRHSFYPFFEDSKPSYTAGELMAINNAKVTYNGEQLPQEKALQIQRGYERQVRRWKRAEAGQRAADMETTAAAQKVKDYQQKLRDFTRETGLKRDYTRERM